MKQQVNQHHSKRSFEVGDMVYLRLQTYWQSSVAFWKYMKLSPPFYGSFQVLTHVWFVAYRLALHFSCKIHHVFHVSCLKKKISHQLVAEPKLPAVNKDEQVLFEPLAIPDYRIVKYGNSPKDLSPDSLVQFILRGCPMGRFGTTQPPFFSLQTLRTKFFRGRECYIPTYY